MTGPVILGRVCLSRHLPPGADTRHPKQFNISKGNRRPGLMLRALQVYLSSLAWPRWLILTHKKGPAYAGPDACHEGRLEVITGRDRHGTIATSPVITHRDVERAGQIITQGQAEHVVR